MTGIIIVPVSLISTTTSDAIQVPSGFTLVGVDLPEMTSTSFTLQHTTSTDGTFKTIKDALGLYGTAGNAITFTIGGTSIGAYPIPANIAGILGSWIKFVFSSSESMGFNAIFRQIA